LSSLDCNDNRLKNLETGRTRPASSVTAWDEEFWGMSAEAGH